MENKSQEKLDNFYQELEKLSRSGQVLNVWSNQLLLDLYKFLYEKSAEWKDDWITAYLQLYSWEFQSFQEGVETYYTNFYGDNDYLDIIKTASFLQKNGFEEIYQIYISAAFDSRENFLDYPIDWEQKLMHVDQWIDNNTKLISDCMLKILLENIRLRISEKTPHTKEK